jgi:hypothetical protein
MKAVVVYESMYGNTRRVAEAVGRGLAETAEVNVVPVGRADIRLVEGADLVVVGGPTHVHGMSRPSTRKAAAEQAAKQPGTVLDPDAAGAGLDDWFDALGPLRASSAAFDTRAPAPAVLTGRASKAIDKQLRHHGLRPVVEPESFLVNKANLLQPGEEARAREWGRRLGRSRSTECLQGW